MGRAEGKTHLKVESPTRLLVTKMLRRNGFKLHFTLLATQGLKKGYFLNSRFHNFYFPSCQKKATHLFPAALGLCPALDFAFLPC